MANIPMGQVKPNNWNPNEMTEAEFAELVTEIQHLGKPAKPIVLRRNGQDYEIVDGEHTYRALLQLEIPALQPGWYEVEDYNDFEAMRQTYKRNQHGRHNPVKQGQLFKRMMTERGLTQRALADEIELSEGTIRNSLEYTQAAEKRNDYGFSQLSVKQVRAYNRLPDVVGNLWLDCGASLKVLHKGAERVEAFKDSWDSGFPLRKEEGEDLSKHISKLGCLLELIPLYCGGRTPESFAKAVEKVRAVDKACDVYKHPFRKPGKGNEIMASLSREDLLPYLRVLAVIRWKDDSLKWLIQFVNQSLEAVLRLVDGKVEIVVPVDAFEALVNPELGNWSNSNDLQEKLKILAVTYRPDLRKQDVRAELMKIELEQEAPPFINNALIDLREKYDLWKAGSDIQKKYQLDYMTIYKASEKVIQEIIRRHWAYAEAEKLKFTDPESAVKIQSANYIGSIWHMLYQTIEGEASESWKALSKGDFGSKGDMIKAMVTHMCMESPTIREGTIAGKPASLVLAERLSHLDEPELSLILGYMLGGDIRGSLGWFAAMGGKRKPA